jgi:hypothetical protein
MLKRMSDPILSALVPAAIGAVFGGAAGALITARSNAGLDRARRLNEASAALWDYQRALLGYAASLYDRAGYSDTTLSIRDADLGEVRATLKVAYPWATYLSRGAQDQFFRYPFIEIGEPPYDQWWNSTAPDSAEALATGLARELEIVFPLQRPTPAQGWRRWRANRLKRRSEKESAKRLTELRARKAKVDAGEIVEPDLPPFPPQ